MSDDDCLSVKKPFITIGIPIKNRYQYIEKLLRAIENLEYPKEKICLVFVDDYSTDGTYEALVAWKEKVERKYFKIILIQERTNIPQARNLCVKYMEGDYLLFWDSDVIPPKDLLSEMITIMEKDSSIGIIGADYTYDPSLNIKYRPVTSKETHALYMGFTLIRKRVFDSVGLFNENLSVGEDTEFCIRVREKTRYRILWAPRPVLHLKASRDVKKGIYAWLVYNFHDRADEYYRAFNELPMFLKMRLIYYIGLPLAIILSLVTFIISERILAIVSLTYLMPSLYLVIKQKGLKEGIITWLAYNLPTGLSLSYGFLLVFLRRLLKNEH